MWTGLGVIFIIVLFLIPIVKWIGILIVGGASASSSNKYVQKEIAEAEQEKARLASLESNRIMDAEFRQQKLSEPPDSVVIGEEYDIKQEWKNGQGWVFPFTIKKSWYAWTNTALRFKYFVAKNEENGYTDNFYEYVNKIEFADNTDKQVWQNTNGTRMFNKYDSYDEVCKHQCQEYCEAISMLAHRYINFIGYDEFKGAFISLLIRDRELTKKFIRECHAANMWKEEYSQLYDCDNYLKDFMIENDIRERVKQEAECDIRIPPDLRHFREFTNSSSARKHIGHELAKRGRIGEAAKSEEKSNSWFGAVSILTLIGVILIIAMFANSGNREVFNSMFWIVIVLFFVWTFFVIMSAGHNSSSEQVKKDDDNEKYYKNMFPIDMNYEGKQYGAELAERLLKQSETKGYHDWRY